MLGFAPLAAAPLANDAIYEFVGAAVVAGAPSVGASTITQTHVFTSVAITTGAPSVPDFSVYEDETFVGADIVAGSPVHGSPVMVQIQHLLASSFATDTPDVGVLPWQWTEIYDVTTVWTEQTDTTATWTNVA